MKIMLSKRDAWFVTGIVRYKVDLRIDVKSVLP